MALWDPERLGDIDDAEIRIELPDDALECEDRLAQHGEIGRQLYAVCIGDVEDILYSLAEVHAAERYVIVFVAE